MNERQRGASVYPNCPFILKCVFCHHKVMYSKVKSLLLVLQSLFLLLFLLSVTEILCHHLLTICHTYHFNTFVLRVQLGTSPHTNQINTFVSTEHQLVKPYVDIAAAIPGLPNNLTNSILSSSFNPSCIHCSFQSLHIIHHSDIFLHRFT